ncbi:hypothetical protein ACVTMO_08140 [Pseudomonas segetis]|uniref:Zinc-ribbon domain-containing protein n=1 Tax=Pseudomonas segetis TaxID=298908 RepID=A0A238ZLL6_9PSED|nr:hypothetical protein [Pseudomonas segetis]SNR84295.1 hypothetical protein SAMN05216255_0528 [Pseudomonas segetis]
MAHTCKDCGTAVAATDKKCPACGAELAAKPKLLPIAAFMLIVILVIQAYMDKPENKEPAATEPAKAASQ